MLRTAARAGIMLSVLVLNQHAGATGHRLVAAVGIETIWDEDIRLKQSVERCYGDTLSEAGALVMLMQDMLEREVLRMAFGEVPSVDVLRERSHWIDTHTRDSVRLPCIKTRFYGEDSQYLRLVVEPTLINPRLHERYERDHTQDTFDAWFRNVVKERIVMTIADSTLDRRVRQAYSGQWWIDVLVK